MKIMTILGTRPEIIRLSLIIRLLDSCADHLVLHTGQNFDRRLSQIFFDDLQIRAPDFHLELEGSTAFTQIGSLLAQTEKILLETRPDRVLILGDTNSGLTAMIAKRMGIPVFHMEAGNRCFDPRVPEETNRKIIDHSSDVLLPYTERSRANLLAEGIPSRKIFVTGNPIFEVLEHYKDKIETSPVLDSLNVKKNSYFLVTAHRAENVDDPTRLQNIFQALERLGAEYQRPLIVSTHPRTKAKLKTSALRITSPLIRLVEPFNFFDFVKLEKNAACVLSDSGTVQEECSLFQIPNVTIRTTTERPETLEAGSNIVSGLEPDQIVSAVQLLEKSESHRWQPPPEYLVQNVSMTIAKILLSQHQA